MVVWILVGFIAGVIVTAVLFNNKHHRDVAQLFDEIDRHVDRASDMSSNTWRKIRRKISAK